MYPTERTSNEERALEDEVMVSKFLSLYVGSSRAASSRVILICVKPAVGIAS